MGDSSISCMLKMRHLDIDINKAQDKYMGILQFFF